MFNEYKRPESMLGVLESNFFNLESVIPDEISQQIKADLEAARRIKPTLILRSVRFKVIEKRVKEKLRIYNPDYQ